MCLFICSLRSIKIVSLITLTRQQQRNQSAALNGVYVLRHTSIYRIEPTMLCTIEILNKLAMAWVARRRSKSINSRILVQFLLCVNGSDHFMCSHSDCLAYCRLPFEQMEIILIRICELWRIYVESLFIWNVFFGIVKCVRLACARHLNSSKHKRTTTNNNNKIKTENSRTIFRCSSCASTESQFVGT